ncbi:glycosyltransferase family 2 protein [Desulfovibrio sp. OttesenSCG-928-C14]|nr:glycosyltransferase family 2 protein [Desulfovibrio sp. OttesenSCG-928-C14]
MSSILASVVIPVYNKWELTENCLKSLHQTLPLESCEVVVVDNASCDKTQEACPALGRAFFGSNFIYHRSDTNLNFGPASNLGARLGRGSHVLFLNNDTIAAPGWFEPLLNDFTDYANVAATGPLLIYPGDGPLGPIVQHLGVFISPFYKVGHLYDGIPACSSLAQKRRFFQIITAACMLMPKDLFLKHGGFDEEYINGFEDVDLCARLWNDGLRMTVNPDSRILHLTSQTPGRHDNETHNSRLFAAKVMNYLVPDWQMHLSADGLKLHLTEWQSLCIKMPERHVEVLERIKVDGNIPMLCELIAHNPFWYGGYLKLVELLRGAGRLEDAYGIMKSLARLYPAPANYFRLLEAARLMGDEKTLSFCVTCLRAFSNCFEHYSFLAEENAAFMASIGLEDMAEQYQGWFESRFEFRSAVLHPFMVKIWDVMAKGRSMFEPWVYAAWRELIIQREGAHER